MPSFKIPEYALKNEDFQYLQVAYFATARKLEDPNTPWEDQCILLDDLIAHGKNMIDFARGWRPLKKAFREDRNFYKSEFDEDQRTFIAECKKSFDKIAKKFLVLDGDGMVQDTVYDKYERMQNNYFLDKLIAGEPVNFFPGNTIASRFSDGIAPSAKLTAKAE